MAARRAAPPSLWSGNERLRIGERLQASLAGLLELELLRETRRGSVQRALHESRADGPPAQQEEDPNSPERAGFATPKLDRSKSEDLLGTPKEPRASYSSSENIEALHTDAGGRADPRCLGLQMMGESLLSPKKVGGHGGDTQEIPEADSRPSSGFYETSEVGSLSDSCASMHSDGPGGSRCSVGSLSHLPGLRESHLARPHSTDEAAVRLLDLRLQHLALAPGADSRRPVSTGDLEFLLGLGDLSLPLPKNPSLRLLHYTSDLVSRNTNEVYHYPSPLHAVALQSPLFTSSLSQSSSQEDLDEGAPPEPARTGSPEAASASPREEQKARLDLYVAKLVLRYKCRSAAGRTEAGPLAGRQKSLSLSSVCGSVLGAGQLLAPAPGWKIRRRISTCSHLRSPEGSEGTRDSRVLDGQGDFTQFLEVGSVQASSTKLDKAGEPSVLSLPDALLPSQEPSVSPCPDKLPGRSGRGAPSRPGEPQGHPAQAERPCGKRALFPQADGNKLYKGKHASRELVKTPERPEKGSERSWLSPRELLRRLSFRRRPSARVGSRARASSEINIHVAAGLACHGEHHAARGKAAKPRWASVLEISSKAPGRHRPKAATFHHPPHVLHRHLAFPSDSPASFCFLGGSHLDLPPRPRPGLASSTSGLGRVEATSALSLNGDWILHQLGDKWPPTSATLDPADLPVRGFKLRRSRSFKELRKVVSRSIRGSRTTK
ncbi:hypothetical protein EYD10_14770 [Varanus komodoensis]|uniref:dapper homolog 2-like n=1 Tax=Varanus komodoensis TaxID=61221 RepID=UPI001CF7E878|nr:dapper homolog 2-like [Varanus komodoensis]KAF7238582.1 hypothetical protein EYD10_14770 [Varanus komodoensis]